MYCRQLVRRDAHSGSRVGRQRPPAGAADGAARARPLLLAALITSVLRSSECGRALDAFADEDDIWRPLFERRNWANVVPRTV